MRDVKDDDLLLHMIESVAVAVLDQIGDDQDARFRFFKGLVALSQQTVREAQTARPTRPY